MNIEAVICCVDYADFLAETLPTNRSLFDKLVVVTAPEDKATQRVCEYWHVEVVLTDDFESRWGDFNKGSGINAGLAQLTMVDWVVHLDADIMLPPLFRRLIETAELDKSMIYGADRFLIHDAETWREHMAMPRLQQEDNVYVHADAFPLGTRISSPDYGGYVPIGFFQLWHPQTSGVHDYPAVHGNAGRGDMVFTKNWPRSKRALLPEVIVYHLESEQTPQGANWNGRKTKPFSVMPSHRKPHHRHHHHRHHHYGES